MSNNVLLEMTNEIQAFIEKFEAKYGQFIRITIGVDKSTIISEQNTLRGIERVIIKQMHAFYPELSYINSFKYKTRKLKFMRFSQAFQYIAHQNGFKKLTISKHIERHHATVISSIRQVEAYLWSGNESFLGIYLPLFKKVKNYVGTISNNAERQVDTQSVFTSICSEEQDINTADKCTPRAESSEE